MQIEQDIPTKCTNVYKTKAAMQISQVVNAENPALHEFDKIRSILKAKMTKNQKPTLSEREIYLKELAKLHTAVISSRETLRKDVKEFEQEYYKHHRVFPEEDEYCHLQKPLSIAKKLLVSWKSLHI